MAKSVIALGTMHTAPVLKQRIFCRLVPVMFSQPHAPALKVYEGEGVVVAAERLAGDQGGAIRAIVELGGDVPDADSWTLLTWRPLE